MQPYKEFSNLLHFCTARPKDAFNSTVVTALHHVCTSLNNVKMCIP